MTTNESCVNAVVLPHTILSIDSIQCNVSVCAFKFNLKRKLVKDFMDP